MKTKKNSRDRINSSRVFCSDHGQFRTVVFEGDGRITVSEKGVRGGITTDITDDVKQFAVAIALGHGPAQTGPGSISTAIAFAALIAHGLPRALANGRTDVRELGPWKDIYIRWESNKLVEQILQKRNDSRRMRGVARTDEEAREPGTYIVPNGSPLAQTILEQTLQSEASYRTTDVTVSPRKASGS